MKFLYMLALAFILSSSSKAQITLVKQKKLMGKVKLSTSASYKAVIRLDKVEKGEKVAGDRRIQYDKRGNEIERKNYDINGGLVWKYTTEYDTSGNKIEYICYQPNESPSLVFKTNYTYDINGNRILLERANPSYPEYGWNYIYSYDNQGNRIEFNDFSKDGSLNSRKTYKYDAQGNAIEFHRFNADGSLDSRSTYKYDTKGNKIESNSFEADGSFDARYTYKYDMQGNETEKSSFKANGSLSWKKTYAYDLKGNKVLYKRYKANGDLKSSMSWEYTYDQQGNWTKQIKFKNKIAQEITERTFEYYN
jgi:hypothetical protein